jgi:cytochrome c oxidase assembly protein subunit 15
MATAHNGVAALLLFTLLAALASTQRLPSESP